METQPHNGHSPHHPARTVVEAAFKHAGLTSEQAQTVMDALDEYVLHKTIATRKKKNPAPKRRGKHR